LHQHCKAIPSTPNKHMEETNVLIDSLSACPVKRPSTYARAKVGIADNVRFIANARGSRNIDVRWQTTEQGERKDM
jgi:hypothetical protein